MQKIVKSTNSIKDVHSEQISTIKSEIRLLVNINKTTTQLNSIQLNPTLSLNSMVSGDVWKFEVQTVLMTGDTALMMTLCSQATHLLQSYYSPSMGFPL